ncbi:MAG: hypothetical protein ACR2GZ_02640 [Solirubrobacteraceae bacterium]
MRRLVGLGVVALIVVVLAVAQLVLPGLAAQRLRDQLARSGRVLSVAVDAFPAVELLWRQADHVAISLGRYRSSPQGLARLLNQAGQVNTLSASARELDTGLLTLRDTSLVKRGDRLTGSAQVTEADLRAALPILQSVTPVTSSGGALTLQGTATLFGVTATVQATVSEQGGDLVVTPNVPLGGLATVRVFSDPRLEVQSLSATPTATGFRVTAAGRLH